MAGFNKELALKSVPAGMKRRIFADANQLCHFHTACTKKEYLLLSLDVAQPVNEQIANAVTEGFMNLLTHQLS